jgi:hypothetical protein
LLIDLHNKNIIPWNKVFLEKLIVTQLTKNFLPFIEPQVSLPYSRELAKLDYIMTPFLLCDLCRLVNEDVERIFRSSSDLIQFPILTPAEIRTSYLSNMLK